MFSLGLAATHLRMATTIHKLCGVMDGRYSNQYVLNKILGNEDEHSECTKKLRGMNVLIIDEVSMMSLKTFEQIDFVIRGVRANNKPFGGVQLVLSGDFFQLPPIPNATYGDYGEYCFLSSIWKTAVPHHINLTNVHRQAENDLVAAVRQLSKGEITPETANLIQRYCYYL